MGPKLEQSKKMMWSKAVLDGLLPQECKMRSGCGYLPIPYQDELQETLDKIATFQEAHSTGQGGVESVCAVMQQSRAFETCMLNKQSLLLSRRPDKSLQQAIGPRRSARESKMGHGLS
jgi:hypothetical protein